MAQVISGALTGARIGTMVGGGPGALIGLCIGGGLAIVGTIGVIVSTTRRNAEEAKKKAMQKKDPKLFKQSIKQISEQFIVELQKIGFETVLQKKDKVKDIMFIGVTSAGKSSLINSLFGTKLPIGLGKTTEQTSLGFQNPQMRVWDSVGQNSDFQFYDIDKMAVLHAMDTICIVYRSSPSAVENLVRLICSYKAAKYKVLFVRTSCDEWTVEHVRTLDEEVEQDYKILEQMNVIKPIIYKTSSKNPQACENKKLLQDL